MRFVILHVRVTVFITVRVTRYSGACGRALRKARKAAGLKHYRLEPHIVAMALSDYASLGYSLL